MCTSADVQFKHVSICLILYFCVVGAVLGGPMHGSVSAVLWFLGTVQTLTFDAFVDAPTAQCSHLLFVLRTSALDHADASSVVILISEIKLFDDSRKGSFVHVITSLMFGMSALRGGFALGSVERTHRHRLLQHYMFEHLWVVILSDAQVTIVSEHVSKFAVIASIRRDMVAIALAVRNCFATEYSALQLVDGVGVPTDWPGIFFHPHKLDR